MWGRVYDDDAKGCRVGRCRKTYGGQRWDRMSVFPEVLGGVWH
jgi:hypothetical protein